jgi:hypothetical protein
MAVAERGQRLNTNSNDAQMDKIGLHMVGLSDFDPKLDFGNSQPYDKLSEHQLKNEQPLTFSHPPSETFKDALFPLLHCCSVQAATCQATRNSTSSFVAEYVISYALRGDDESSLP